jgi:hypothetical protein
METEEPFVHNNIPFRPELPPPIDDFRIFNQDSPDVLEEYLKSCVAGENPSNILKRKKKESSNITTSTTKKKKYTIYDLEASEEKSSPVDISRTTGKRSSSSNTNNADRKLEKISSTSEIKIGIGEELKHFKGDMTLSNLKLSENNPKKTTKEIHNSEPFGTIVSHTKKEMTILVKVRAQTLKRLKK